MKIKLYIEGGGDSHLQDTEFRAAWAAFFEKAGLRALRKMPATFRGGGRAQTFDAYCTAVIERPDACAVDVVARPTVNVTRGITQGERGD